MPGSGRRGGVRSACTFVADRLRVRQDDPEVNAMRGLTVIGGMAALLALGGAIGAQAANETVARLAPVGSGVSGVVSLRQLSPSGTGISVFASGLRPGVQYVSLYYDNGSCQLEPYSDDDVIGGPYTADAAGDARTMGAADDDLDEIHSVSVRLASNFQLLACAPVSAGG
jgi:hypothetical protein